MMAVATLIFTSCARKHAFTDAVRKKYGITDEVMGKVQFYVSNDIILYRADSQAGLAIENGEVVVTSNNSEDQIIVKKGTPGAFVSSEGPNKISVRFELGDGRFLWFTSAGMYKGRYHIVAKWERKRGVLDYANEVFYVTPESNSSYLMFKLRRLNSYKKKTTVASGVKVD